jgi:hypothetical protein
MRYVEARSCKMTMTWSCKELRNCQDDDDFGSGFVQHRAETRMLKLKPTIGPEKLRDKLTRISLAYLPSTVFT